MRKIILISVLGATLASCSDYLNLQPRGKAIPESAEDFSALLNTLLDDIDNAESPVIGNYDDLIYFESFADDLDANMMSPEGVKYGISQYVGAYYESLYVAARYNRFYNIINTCNMIIGGLSDDDSAKARDVKGASYALRGVCYYELMRTYCDSYDPAAEQLGLALVTEFDMEARPVRSSMQATMRLIESDLTTAAAYDVQEPMYRFQKNVVNGFLARFYFWTEQYSKAIPLAESVLAAYPLLGGEDYKAMITAASGLRGNMIIRAGVRSSDQTTQNVSKFTNNIAPSRPVNGKLDRLFAEKTDDIRYGTLYGVSRSNWRIAKKNPLACMRSAEMCMILAESHYHGNDNGEALRYLNLLRSNRIANYAELTEQTLPAVRDDETIVSDATGKPLTPLIYAILCERRKEMFMEGDRWFELKRNGKPEFWIGFNGRKFVTQEYMYTAPIPYHDIVIVEGLQQNPGYDEVL